MLREWRASWESPVWQGCCHRCQRPGGLSWVPPHRPVCSQGDQNQTRPLITQHSTAKLLGVSGTPPQPRSLREGPLAGPRPLWTGSGNCSVRKAHYQPGSCRAVARPLIISKRAAGGQARTRGLLGAPPSALRPPRSALRPPLPARAQAPGTLMLLFRDGAGGCRARNPLRAGSQPTGAPAHCLPTPCPRPAHCPAHAPARAPPPAPRPGRSARGAELPVAPSLWGTARTGGQHFPRHAWHSLIWKEQVVTTGKTSSSRSAKSEV